GERLLDVLLDHAGQRTGAELVVVTLLSQPLGRPFRELDGDAAICELRLELEDELLDNLEDDLRRQARERDDRVEAIAELRSEQLVDRLLVLALALRAVEAHGSHRQTGRARVRRHDHADDAAADLSAV